MSFLAPWMLFGAAAASVPIILHLFFRSRYRTVPWAAMKFLLTSIEQTSRRLKFQELLLLLLRCLVLAVLALAMARPVSSAARGTGRGDAVDAVFVLDNSYSMTAADGPESRLDRAKSAAVKVLDKLPPHSTIQIVAASDRAETIGPRSASNLDQGRHLIQKLETVSLSSDLAPAIAEAKALLERGQLPNKELYLFSDMQKLGWDAQPEALKKELREIKEKAGVFLVRAGTRTPKNAAIIDIAPQAGVPRPNERIAFAVLVRNTGAEDLSDVVITLTADPSIKSDSNKGEDKEKTETQTIPVLKAGETRAVTMAAKFEKAGSRVLSARIKHDDVPGDNRFDRVIPVRNAVNVLVINGDTLERDPTKSATFYLNHALLPVRDVDVPKYFVQLKEYEPRLASPALLAKADVVFLVNAGVADPKKPEAGRRVLPTDFVAELGRWVRQGHGLVIVPGENVVPEAYNRAFGDLLPMPLGKLRTYPAEPPTKVSRGSFDLPAFEIFREDAYYEKFNQVQVDKGFDLIEPKEGEKGGRAVLRYNTGGVALAAKKVDDGDVFLFTTAIDRTWSDWPFLPEFLPLVQILFQHLLQEQAQSDNVVAGQSVTWTPRDKELRNFTLQTPTGEPIRLGLPIVKEKRQILNLPPMLLAGVYRLLDRAATQVETAQDAGVPIAVIPDLRESQDFTALTDEQIDARLGFRPVHMSAGGEEAASDFDRFQREWTLWLLLAVLALAVAESALAWFCGRSS